jgi:hypothetical protein
MTMLWWQQQWWALLFVAAILGIVFFDAGAVAQCPTATLCKVRNSDGSFESAGISVTTTTVNVPLRFGTPLLSLLVCLCFVSLPLAHSSLRVCGARRTQNL